MYQTRPAGCRVRRVCIDDRVSARTIIGVKFGASVAMLSERTLKVTNYVAAAHPQNDDRETPQ